MARGSYLEQIASRAVQDTRGLLRPRRPVLAPSPAPPDDPGSAARVPFAVTPAAAPGDPAPPGATAPRDSVPVPPARPHLGPDLGTSVAAAPTSPLVDGSAVAPPDDPSPRTPPSPRSAPRPKAAEAPPARPPVEVALPPSADPLTKAPTARGRIAPPRPVPAAPDPLALALAAAVRWTSSDERPGADARQPSPEPPSQPPPLDPGRGREVAVPAASRPEPSSAPLSSRLPSGPEGPVAHQDRSTRAPFVDAAGIHIGSVEVQILAPPPVTAPAPKPASTARPAAGPLARGLTSAIGLRQG